MFFPVACVLERFAGLFPSISPVKRFACRWSHIIPVLLAGTNVVLGSTPQARGETIELLKDITPGRSSSFPLEPLGMVEVNGIIYFAAGAPGHGHELWRSDGT